MFLIVLLYTLLLVNDAAVVESKSMDACIDDFANKVGDVLELKANNVLQEIPFHNYILNEIKKSIGPFPSGDFYRNVLQSTVRSIYQVMAEQQTTADSQKVFKGIFKRVINQAGTNMVTVLEEEKQNLR